MGFIALSLVALNFQVQVNHNHIAAADNSGGNTSRGSEGISSTSAITNDSDVGVIPGVRPNQGISVGTVLQGCYGVVSNPSDPNAAKLKTNCDVVVGYVVNYCLDHMNNTIAQQNKQVCWNHDVMEEGLRYAVAYLDGGTGRMVKTQSDIMGTIANVIVSANAGLSKEALLNKCMPELEAKTGLHFTQDLKKAFLAGSTKESLEKLCYG